MKTITRFLFGLAVIVGLVFPFSANAQTLDVCYKTATELDMDLSSNANTRSKLSNPNYFGASGTVAPETFVFRSLATVTATSLSTNGCDIFIGGGFTGNPATVTQTISAAEGQAVYAWAAAGNRIAIAGCDRTADGLCSELSRTLVGFGNDTIDVNSALSYNPIDCGGAGGVATYGGQASYIEPIGTDSVLATHSGTTNNGTAAVVTDDLLTPTFVVTADADMFGSSGAADIGAGATATTNQAIFVLNAFKFAADAVQGRLAQPQCLASYDNTADLELTITSLSSPVVVGGTVTMSVEVVNRGSSDASDVAAAIVLPTGLSYVSQTGDGSFNSSTGDWTIGTLANGASATLTLTLDVTAQGSLTVQSELTNSSLADRDSQTNASFGVDDRADGVADDDEDSVTVLAVAYDFGDAPDSYGDASHTLSTSPTVYLGTAPDSETDTQLGGDAGAGADGDDNNGTDDEDGVTIPPLTLGIAASISVDVAGTGGFLQGWIDWNQDGDFADLGEQLLSNVQDNGLGDTDLTVGRIGFTVTPALSASSGSTYARFRWSSTSGLATTGTATDGEVEDYEVVVRAPPGGTAPIDCDGTLYQIATSDSTLKRLNFSQSGGSYTASLTNIGSAGQQVNAGWGFSELDRLLYGVRSGTRELWRIDANASFTNLGAIPATAANGSNAGDILPDGMMIYKESTTTWQLLDISDPSNPVDAGDLVLSTAISSIDFGLNPIDGYIYAVDPTTDRLFYVDITGYDAVGTGNTLAVTPVFFGPATHTGSYGATWFDEDGNMFLWNNGNNTIYKADIGVDGDGSGELLEIAVSSDDEGGINDGAYCRGPAPIPLGSIGGTLYEDVDGSNTLNSGDVVLGANISVSAYYDNGTADTADDTFVGTAQTDSSGVYSFGGALINQTYRLEVDTADPDIPVGASAGTANPVQGVVVTADTTTTVDFGFDVVRDYGDAPASYGGAAHGVSAALRIGALTDTESATQLGGDAGVGADGDDTSGSDDEDGVGFNSALYTSATSYTIPSSDITVTNSSGGAATLHAWLDFDRNGSFDSDEHTSVAVADGTTNGSPSSGLSWSGAGVSGMSAGITYARFRLTTDASVDASTPGSSANGGEVEDHALLIQDLPTICDGSSINELSFQNPSLSAGSALSVNAQYRFPDVVPGLDALITLTGFNNGAGLREIDYTASGLANAFQPYLDAPNPATSDASVDFNIQFVLSGSDIQYALDRIFASGIDIDGNNGSIREYIELSEYSSYALESPTNLDYTASPGTGYDGRFESRTSLVQPGISTTATENIARAVFERVAEFNYRIGLFNSGSDVTDRQNSLFLECVSLDDTEDHGDAPLSYGDAVHEVASSATVYLGTVSPDVETEAQQGGDAGLGADGDDGDGTDDEDGVSFGSVLSTGSSNYSATVNVTNTASSSLTLVGWIDFDRSGSFDADEAASLSGVLTGTQTLNWSSIPADTVAGTTYARFRLSTEPLTANSAVGTASDGEVEDYELTTVSQLVSGTVFYDDGLKGGAAHDGLQNGGELGIAEVTVTVSDGTNSASTLTNARGEYLLVIPDSLSGDVTVSHSLRPATGSSIGGATVANCLASAYADTAAADQLVGDSDCSGSVDGAETGYVANTAYTDYDFGVVRSSRFISDQSGQASSPSVVDYDHLYTPGTLGSVTLSATGGLYSYQVFVDENCDGSYAASEGPQILPYSFTVDSSWPRLGNGHLQECAVTVRVLVPDGEADAATDTVTLNTDLQWQSNMSVTDKRFVTDTTVITEGGQLELIKEVRNVTQSTAFATIGTGKPGEVLEYRIGYTNRGADQVTAVAFSDPVPPFTVIETDQYGATGEVELVCPDTSVIAINTGAVSTVQVDIMSECGVVQIGAGEGGTVTYRVRID